MRYLFIIFLLLSANLYSQETISYDKVYKNDKTLIEGKVLRITETQVEFDPKGEIPFILIPRSEVAVIIYSDNTVVNFNSETIADMSTKTKEENILKPKEDILISVEKDSTTNEPIIVAETVNKIETVISKPPLKTWSIEYRTTRNLKEKMFNYKYTFDTNTENGMYSIYDDINDKLIHIKETGSFNAEINTNKHSKKRSLFIYNILLDLEFKIGNEMIKHTLTSEDLGWDAKNGFKIEGPINITKRAPLPLSERKLETNDYIISYYIELMSPNKVFINYSIATKNK